MTEDRRRRIRALRQVHSNAEKLKSSRNYHSQGAAVVESFEENALKGLGLVHTRSQAPAKSPPPLPLSAYDVSSSDRWIEISQSLDHVPEFPGLRDLPSYDREYAQGIGKVLPSDLSRKSIKHRRLEILRSLNDENRLLEEWERLRQKATISSRYGAVGPEDIDRQGRLAFDIMALMDNAVTLQGAEKGHALDSAATRFVEAFRDGMDIQGIKGPLLYASIQLSRNCVLTNRFPAALKILETFLSSPIDEKVFHQLGPAPVIRFILRDPVFKAGGKDSAVRMKQRMKIRRAIRLFLPKLKDQPIPLSKDMAALGELLCKATCDYGLYHMTDRIYRRLVVGQKEEDINASKYLIIAAHEQGDDTSTIEYFKRYHAMISSDKAEFSAIFSRLITSLLKSHSIIEIEECLAVAQAATDRGNCTISMTELLRLMGHHWRTGHNLERTEALFNNLRALIYQTERPEAAFAAIIQFCVEAGEEAKAIRYYDDLLSATPTALPNIRISGHLALAKAMRGDWSGVRKDFEDMSNYPASKADPNACSDVFVPILKIFAATHQIKETEEFLHSLIGDCKIRLNAYMSNIMVDAYARVGAIDSLAKWIEYAASVGCPFDSVSINIILNKCHSRWQFTFDDMNRLFKYIRENLSGYTEGLINAETISIMRRIAMTEYKGNTSAIAAVTSHLGLQPKSAGDFNSQRLQEEMAKALAMNEPGHVLILYKEGLVHRDVQTSSEMLATAVKASLQVNGNDISPAMSLLEQAKRHGCKDLTSGMVSVFMHRLSQLDAKELVESTSKFIFQNIKQRGIPVPMQVVTHTTNILVKTHRYEEALAFWNSMSPSLGGSSCINLPTLTVLLNAHIGLGHCQGIKWVIRTLVENNMEPDKQFVQTLKNARRTTGKRIKLRTTLGDGPGYDILGFQAALEDALQKVMAIRAEARLEKMDVKQRIVGIIEKAMEDQRGPLKASHVKGSERLVHAEYSA